MKLLVLGATGQLGAEIVGQGVSRGFDMVAAGRSDVNVEDPAAFRAYLDETRPERVVNTTAFHVVPDCDRYPERAFAVNAAAVKHMAEACRERGIGFVTYSTDYVFDGTKGSPYLESDLPRPLQSYGVSKYAGEILASLFHPESMIIRTCGVYGGTTGSRSKRGNFVLTMLRESESKSELEVSAEQIVNPTYARDLATATLDLLGSRPDPGLYHLAAEGHCSWADFAAATMELSGRTMRIRPVDHGGQSGTLRRPLFSALENSRARQRGVVLPHWRDGLGRYLSALALTSRS